MTTFPSTAELLVSGGDSRITPDPQTGRNKYGCSTLPDVELIALGSSTASIISERGLAAANLLRDHCATLIEHASPESVYAEQIQSLRVELLSLCGITNDDKVSTLLAASGTDIHLLLAQWLEPDLTLMIDPAETGSGLVAALQGKHFSSDSTCAGGAPAGSAVSDWHGELKTFAAREPDGRPRHPDSVDHELAALVESAVTANKRILLILTDVCKTGLIFPDISIVKKLQQQWPTHLQVVVDACQFRLSTTSLRAYLAHDFCIALTGSKFLGGPTFSGALLIPDAVAKAHQDQVLHAGARAYSYAGDWPVGFKAALNLDDGANFGLLLRWEAAMAELRRFAALNDAQLRPFLRRFFDVVGTRLALDPHFEPVQNPPLDRSAIGSTGSWDNEQTIFPFIIYQTLSDDQRRPLTRSETAAVYQQLQSPTTAPLQKLRFQLGQPVLCGERMGTAVSALRLCISAPMLIAAQKEDQADKIITDALLALDRIVELVALL